MTTTDQALARAPVPEGASSEALPPAPIEWWWDDPLWDFDLLLDDYDKDC